MLTSGGRSARALNLNLGYRTLIPYRPETYWRRVTSGGRSVRASDAASRQYREEVDNAEGPASMAAAVPMASTRG